MTAIDLAAVCARHGLLFGQSADGLWWCETPDQNPGAAGYSSPEDAVCTILKSVYRISTEHKPLVEMPDVNPTHTAYFGVMKFPYAHDRQSKLAAVVKLADLLASRRQFARRPL